MKQILITGSEGMLGKSLISSLSSFSILGIDRSPSVTENKHLQIQADLNSINTFKIKNIKNTPHTIIHLAALSTVQEAQENPLQLKNDNVHSIINMIKIIEKTKKKPHIIFSSSREVYGETSMPAKETDPCHPLNEYGKSKLKGEQLWIQAAKKHLFPLTILRFSNIYGSLFDKPSRLIPSLYQCIKEDSVFSIYGGEQKIDLIHVYDGIRAIKLSILNAPPLGNPRVLNIASGRSFSINQILDIANQFRKIKVQQFPQRINTVKSFFANIKEANQTIGFYPIIDLHHGLKMLLNMGAFK